MSEPLVFSFSGDPRGQGRPRAAKRGGFISVYKDPKSRKYEDSVAEVAAQAMAGRTPFVGALSASYRFRLPIPTSYPKWRREAMAAGEIAPTTKPDLSNMLKAMEDGMNGVVFVDDCQIVRTFLTKIYHPTPGVDVRVAPLDVESDPTTPSTRSAA
ncbi:RusA family crossover junction endodeoxyribonuclease [Phenylobacterium sp.]|uniref:RusA family crossover junction endodeoxyribonuclease n=1 Tax=Phenylobacterium sp. TaxID=1871053 RepID=UPI00273801A9|nr:RusA family crossover junction endodeoxyribonuclease [Phenylobacterium sp.]MDP3869156.1 RusA family crossover junction endodeoxyribonuclease [Phenylobacterium sp.]